MDTLHATTIAELEAYQRKHEQEAQRVLMENVRRLRQTLPETPEPALMEIAMGDEQVRRKVNRELWRARSIARTIRKRKRRQEKEATD